MTAVLVVVMVACFGTWIPLSQSVGSATQHRRILYVAAGNLAVAVVAVAVGSGHLTLGWRALWLPLAGGVAWTGGVFAAFRATEQAGLARAAGTWAPLNIVTAFVLGILLFHELDHSSTVQLAAIGTALVLVVIGVLVIVRSQGSGSGSAALVSASSEGMAAGAALGRTTSAPPGLVWAVAAGILWGGYFVPAQWAGVSAAAGNLPLAIGIALGAVVLAVAPGRSSSAAPGGTGAPAKGGVAAPGGIAGAGAGVETRPGRRRVVGVITLVGAGVLFGIGDVALLAVVKRLGTGVGFTLAQLSLVVNAAIGIWVLKVPTPGSRDARIAVCGIVLAGSGGLLIGWLR